MRHQDTQTKQMYVAEEAQSEAIEVVPSKTLKGISSLKRAFEISVTRSGFSHDSIGDAIGKRREQVTKFVGGSAGLTADAIEDLINETGNIIPLQYLLRKYGYVAVKDPNLERRATLQAELDKLDAVA